MRVPRCRFWMSGESTPSRGVAGNPWIPRRAPRPPWEEYLSLNGRTTSLRPLPHGGLIMGGGSEVEAGEGFFAGLKRRRVIRVLRSEEHTSELQSLMRNSYAVSCLKK